MIFRQNPSIPSYFSGSDNEIPDTDYAVQQQTFLEKPEKSVQ